MTTSIFGIVALLLAVLAMALQRFYSCVPAKELKRLAARGDHLAQALYRPVAYGTSLRLLLWLVMIVTAPASFFLLVQGLPAIVAVLLMALAVAMAFVWLPSVHLSVHSARFAVWAAPVLEKILHYTHPFLDGTARMLNRYRSLQPHSGLFEKEDFAALLAQQQSQVDNRMTDDDLNLLHRVLHFGDKKAADITVLRKKLRLVGADESLGPILLDELHKSGQPVFLVYQDKPDNITGSLPMKYAAGAKAGGHVAELMRHDLCFVHEDFGLQQVADALMQTKQYIAVVVNGFGEFVGAITLERLLQEAFGQQPAADLSYEDRAAVADYRPPQPTDVAEDNEETPNEELSQTNEDIDTPAEELPQTDSVATVNEG